MDGLMVFLIMCFIVSSIMYLSLCFIHNRDPFNPFRDRNPKLPNWNIQTLDSHNINKANNGGETNGK